MRITIYDVRMYTLGALLVLVVALQWHPPVIVTDMLLIWGLGVPLMYVVQSSRFATWWHDMRASQGKPHSHAHGFVVGMWVLVTVVSVVGIVWWFSSSVAEGVTGFTTNYADRTSKAQASLAHFLEWLRAKLAFAIEPKVFDEKVAEIRTSLITNSGSLLKWSIGHVGSGVSATVGSIANWALILLGVIFVAVEGHHIETKVRQYVEAKFPVFAAGLVYNVDEYQKTVRTFFSGIGICMAIYTGEFFALFLVLGVPPGEALICACLCGVMAGIPELGGGLLLIPLAPISLIYFGVSWTTLLVLLAGLAIYLAMVNLVTPRFIGERVGVPSVVIMMTMMGMVSLVGGLPGVLVSIIILSQFVADYMTCMHKDEEVHGPMFVRFVRADSRRVPPV